jgi:hypothetical protein
MAVSVQTAARVNGERRPVVESGCRLDRFGSRAHLNKGSRGSLAQHACGRTSRAVSQDERNEPGSSVARSTYTLAVMMKR